MSAKASNKRYMVPASTPGVVKPNKPQWWLYAAAFGMFVCILCLSLLLGFRWIWHHEHTYSNILLKLTTRFTCKMSSCQIMRTTISLNCHRSPKEHLYTFYIIRTSRCTCWFSAFPSQRCAMPWRKNMVKVETKIHLPPCTVPLPPLVSLFPLALSHRGGSELDSHTPCPEWQRHCCCQWSCKLDVPQQNVHTGRWRWTHTSSKYCISWRFKKKKEREMNHLITLHSFARHACDFLIDLLTCIQLLET